MPKTKKPVKTAENALKTQTYIIATDGDCFQFFITGNDVEIVRKDGSRAKATFQKKGD